MSLSLNHDRFYDFFLKAQKNQPMDIKASTVISAQWAKVTLKSPIHPF